MSIKNELRQEVRNCMLNSVELKQILEDGDPKWDEAYERGEITHEMFEELRNEVKLMFSMDKSVNVVIDKMRERDSGMMQLEIDFENGEIK